MNFIKRAIMRGSEAPGRSLSPSPPEHRISRPTSVIRPPGKQIIPPESIAVNKTLGEGEFGVVQQGVWTTEDGDKVQVAIKCLSKDRLQNGTQEFLKEASVQQSIDNENIVRLYGVVIDKDNSLMLVTELAPMRSMLECLKESSLRLDFPIPRLCDFAQQICDGMAYLESKRLIHRDLAARNILVFSKNKVKISDFGLSRALGVGKDYYQSNFSINLKLPIAWCAPECINYLKFTSSSDVWAFGVTLWEMFTYGFQPWAGMSGQQILEAIDKPNCQRLEQPDLCPKEYYELMLKCWEDEPEDRPTFSQIFLKLPQIRPVQVKAVKDYPNVTLEKDHLYYKSYDIIITLDKNPTTVPSPGMWKGALTNGKSGFFDPTNTVPFIEPKTSPISLPKTNLVRKESNRKSGRKLRLDMISGPQNDLRHTGHIGYDGAVFGDVSFIGDAYDKLPTRGKPGDDSVSSSMSSIPRHGSPDRDGYHGTNGYGHSWISQESLDVNGIHGDDRQYQDIDDDSLLSDFKIPDLTSSLDFGPSFMDEVLRALDEKEKKLEAKSDPPSSNGGLKLDDFPDMDRSRSTSPGKHSPPPLPTSPPRVEPRRSDSRSEPRKQAKVKPMSASDEKMMESAIALANEFAAQNQMRDSQSPPTSPTTKTEKKRTESESSSDSPNLMSKLKKISIKRSPKQERKRTFSDDLNNKSELDGELPPEAQEAYNMLVVRGSYRDNDESSDNSRQSPERASPASDAAFSASSETQVTEPKPAPTTASVTTRPPLPVTEPRPSPPPKPTPRPRVEPKKSEIPVPRPRPEIIQRVEPTPRIIGSSSVDVPDLKVETKAESSIPHLTHRQQSLPESKTREREELKKTIEIVRVDSPKKEEHVEVGASSLEDLPKADSETKEPSKSFFDEDFSEPSPREIMSKLRERRVIRSLDHQRGLSGDSDPAPARSLREPQGIPGKGPASQTAPTAEEEEVDTNPLRMLRGGAIPIRTGRGAPGTNTKHSLRYPRLQFSNPQFQRMISDPGDRGRHYDNDSEDVAPAVPPRTYSCSDNNNNHNSLPLPPRNPLRPSSLNAKPRERKYPLLLSPQTPGRTSFSFSAQSRKSSSSSPVHDPTLDLPPAPPPPLHQDYTADDDNVFTESPTKSPLSKPVQRHVTKYYLSKVKCSLDQLGFYNKLDPFWVQRVILPEPRTHSDNESSEDVSPLLLVNYKNSENVSYEDLLDFALDREKNCEEIETLQKIFTTEVSVSECMKALEETKWDLQKAIKYIKLKQLISLELGDFNRCKSALMLSSWDVPRAADYMLAHPIPSPESLDV